MEKAAPRSLALFARMSACALLILGGTTPALARTTSYTGEHLGFGVQIVVLNVTPYERSFTVSWPKSASNVCIRGYRWDRGVPSELSFSRSESWSQNEGERWNFTSSRYTPSDDATFDLYDCRNGIAFYRYLVGGGSNPNRPL